MCPPVESLRHLVLAPALLILLHVDHFSVLEAIQEGIIVFVDPRAHVGVARQLGLHIGVALPPHVQLGVR